MVESDEGEKEMVKRDDDDGVTPCVVADNRRLRPLKRSHLSLLRLFSLPRDLSLHYTRGRQHTARAHASPTRTAIPFSPQPRRPPPLSLFLSLARQSGRVFHQNERATNCSKTTCRHTYTDAYACADTSDSRQR